MWAPQGTFESWANEGRVGKKRERERERKRERERGMNTEAVVAIGGDTAPQKLTHLYPASSGTTSWLLEAPTMRTGSL